VQGECEGGRVYVRVVTTSFEDDLQASGTSNSETPSTDPVDVNGTSFATGATSTVHADLDVVARDPNVGKFARIDVHGEHGLPCTFWGMTRPSG